MTLAQVPDDVAACPYSAHVTPPQSFMARLLRRPDRDGAANALTDLLRTSWPAMPALQQWERICAAHRVPGHDVSALQRDFYRRAFAAYLDRGPISARESTALDRLRAWLNVDDGAVGKIERELVGPRLKSAIETELRAGINATIAERIDRAEDALWASPTLRRDVYAATVEQFFQAWFTRLIASRRVSPDQFLEFTNATTQLRINAHFDVKAEAALRECALMWRIDHGDIPPIATSIHLQKDEECYFEAPARWLEHRRQTRTVGYSSAGVSFRIARGVYYHVGQSRPQRIVTEGLMEIERGTVYITSKRLVFSGAVRNFTVRLDAILSVQAFSDGFALEKATGKHPHICFNGSSELALCLMSALLNR